MPYPAPTGTNSFLAAPAAGQDAELDPNLPLSNIEPWPMQCARERAQFPAAGPFTFGGNMSPMSRCQAAFWKLQPSQTYWTGQSPPELVKSYLSPPATKTQEMLQTNCSCTSPECPEQMSPLTPGSEASSLQSKHAQQQSRLNYQSFGDFRQDIFKHSQFIENDNPAAEWCWGIDTSTTASLMHSDHLEPAAFTHTMADCPPTFLDGLCMGALPSPSYPAITTIATQMPRTGSGSPLSSTSDDRVFEYPNPAKQMDNNTTSYFSRPRRGKQSMEQRRKNHIQQEQKRRAMLKHGFHDLTNLIPGLGKRDTSKSIILEKAAEWLEKLICGNKFLRERLYTLESMKQQTYLWKRAESEFPYFQ
ncbi:hypothetical protein QQS21_008732 [Conoideocrella luteorostrata]|uniref:BHLH domain-containing protein n=1 Tax=Conoideocrella luteorostrata TaxID=1105319 RepID=A0AAJ0CL10_9HYPO|nr:hypothetical protein QQS21_008732 [Conoideocrella luteorostrata]